MEPKKRITVTVLWAAAVLAMLGIVGTGVLAHRQFSGGDDERLSVLFDAPVFDLIDQNGKHVTDATLRGNVWVSMVFFASCPGVCPMMTARLAELQKAVPLKDVKMVSISVDPEHDTPEVLKGYASALGADQSRWYFVSGEKDQLVQTLNKGFKLTFEPAHDGQAIVHDQHILLIDRTNHVRGIYRATDADEMKKLAEDARTLAAEKESGT